MSRKPRRKLTRISRWAVYDDTATLCGIIDLDPEPGASKPFLARGVRGESIDMSDPPRPYRTHWAASRALRAIAARRSAP